MPLERYMHPVVPITKVFETPPPFSQRDAICCTMLLLYSANYYISYTESRSYSEFLGFPHEFLGALLSLTPFFGLFVTVCHGFMREVDYKLPLMYSILMCIAGNCFYAAARTMESAIYIAAGRAFLGLGDPTLLLLFYFSSTFSGLLREKRYVKTVAAVTGTQGVAWALQANAHYIPLTGPVAAHNLGAVVCAACWVVLLLAFQAGFRTPQQPQSRRHSEVSAENTKAPLLALSGICAVGTLTEAVAAGAVSITIESRSAWLLAGASAFAVCGALLTAVIRQRKPALLCVLATVLGAVVVLQNVEPREVVELRTAAALSMLAMLLPQGVGLCLLWKMLKQAASPAQQRHLLQASYLLLLAGRVAGAVFVSLASASEFVAGWLLTLTLLTLVAIGTTAAI